MNLTSVVLLRDVLTDENVGDVIREATGKTTRQIEDRVARAQARCAVGDSRAFDARHAE